MIGEFHFLRPAWLLALLPLTTLLWSHLRRRLSDHAWAAECDQALLPHVLAGGATAEQRDRSSFVLALGGVLSVLALAGPSWERAPQPVFRDPSALVMVLDLSRSMDAADVKPSRLARARFKIADLLQRRPSGQTALVVYAASAFAVTPLTDDTRTILSQLPALSTDIMPAQGSRLDLALEKAAELLRQAGAARGDVLVFTDGTTDAQAAVIEERLPRYPFKLSIIAVGTEEGAPVGSDARHFLKDKAGRLVVSRLAPDALSRLARRGRGVFEILRVDDRDLEQVLAVLTRERDLRASDQRRLASDLWLDRGPWLLLPVLALALAGFRRGVLAMCLLALAPLPRPAEALEWRDLWLRADQQGAHALAQGEPERAAALFSDPQWRAAAEYRAGRYEAAAETLARQQDPRSLYNRSNALARLGRYQEAIEGYEAVLEADPDDEDARYNRDLLLERMAQPPPQSQAGGGDSQDQQAADGERGSESELARDHRSDGTQGSAGAGDDAREPQPADTDGETREAPAGEEEAGGAAADASEQPTGPESAGAARARRSRPPTPEEAAPGGEDATLAEPTEDEATRATEQWLRRIPDDPGGLLRRKFLYQYKRELPSYDGTVDDPW
jgi:Ca-activated chloride channel family protein